MSDKITLSAKVEQPLADQVDQYAEEHGLKRSPAIRDLLKDGLEGTEKEEPETRFSVPLPVVIAWWGSIVAAAGLLESTPTMGMGGIAIFIVALGYYKLWW